MHNYVTLAESGVVCVCVRERGGEGEREGGRKRETDREREGGEREKCNDRTLKKTIVRKDTGFNLDEAFQK